MATSSFTRDILRLFFGPIAWALHFLSIYTITGVLCARPQWLASWAGFPVASWSVLGTSVVAAIAIVLVLLLPRATDGSGESSFISQVSRGLGWLALVAIAWETSAAFLVPACVPST
jgi:hypothetical protein